MQQDDDSTNSPPRSIAESITKVLSEMSVPRAVSETVADNDRLLFAPIDPAVGWFEPRRHYGGDAGYDLTAVRSVVVGPGSFALIPTNIKVAFPAGAWGLIVGRSSTFYKRNLIVNPAVVDNGWRGELNGVVFNPTKRRVVIRPGDRIVQLIVFKLLTPACQKVSGESLPPGDRGTQGFGSTGGGVK